MKKPKIPRTRCSNTMTEGMFNTFIRSLLRRGSMRWRPIYETLVEARVERGVYLCSECKNHVPASIKVNGKRLKGVHVDHVIPVVSDEEGFVDWQEFITRLFCEKDNLRVLCINCHDIITLDASKKRTENKSARKLHPLEESSYRNMLSRCYNPKSTGYNNYGARGIEVCKEWKNSFWEFLKDMGPRPDNKTLDRIDVNKGYYKDNCRWASWEEQSNNKTDNHYISYNEDVLTVKQWSIKTGVKANTIIYRLRRGWTTGEALEKVERVRPCTSRLSLDDWAEIQKLRDEGLTTLELSDIFNIDPSQISRKTSKEKIIHGRPK